MSLPSVVLAGAASRPERPAILFGDHPVSYGDLAEWVRRMSAALDGIGIRRWDQVAILAGNVPEFVYALHGITAIGAVAVPLNTMLTPEELGYILADSEARAIIVEIDYLPAVLAVRDRVATLEHVLIVGPPPTPPGTRSLDELLDAGGEAPEVDVADDDLAVIAYTSGTTANPKGAMLTHRNLIANLDQLQEVPVLAGAATDVVLLVLPLFHIYAMNAALNLMLRHGATAVLVDRFDPVGSLALVPQRGVTVLYGVPQMFQAWLAVASKADVDLSTVRLAVSGAAPLPGAVLEAFRDRFGITIWEGYGLTETAPVVTTNALGDVAKPGSIGLALPGLEVRILDEDGTDVVEGDPGEILVRGPNVFRGYWNKDEETEQAFLDGWFRTGDIAYRDADGYLHLVDRSKDLIIVSGFNVFPKEVEQAIAAHPSVAECAVVGVADERTGEAIKAIVVPAPGASVTQEEILEHCRGSLARFKLPREIEFAEALPRHVTGKVLRRMFRE